MLTEFPVITICDLNKYQKSLVEMMPAMKKTIEEIFPISGDFNLNTLQTSSVMSNLSEIDLEMFEKDNTRHVS